MGYRDYSVAKGHIVDSTGHGDFTTITAALNAASSGQTLFIRPGVYTENPPLKAGVDLAAFVCDSFTPNVTILGKCTYSGAGSLSMSGIRLKTNADFCLEITGSSASIVNIHECYIEASNNTAISFTSSSASSALNVFQCRGNLLTTGITYLVQTSPGGTEFDFCIFQNSGASSTPINITSGGIGIRYSDVEIGFLLTNTLPNGIFHSNIDAGTNGVNMITVDLVGTSTMFTLNSYFGPGSASAFSIGVGSVANISNSTIFSTNNFALTGGGYLGYGLIAFIGAAPNGVNVAVQAPMKTI